MAKSGLLNLGNAQKVISSLRGIIDANAIQCIENERIEQVQLLFDLSIQHCKFANRQSSQFWRQRISRFYYASYLGSKCVRFFVFGDHSKDVADHKKVGELPDDFPQRALYSNKLSVLREDRNSCDYDHECKVGDLIISQGDAQVLVKAFLVDVTNYVANRGLTLRSAL